MQPYLAANLVVDRLLHHYDDAKDVRQVLRVLTSCPAWLAVAAETVAVGFEPPERSKQERTLRDLCRELTDEGVTLPRDRHLPPAVNSLQCRAAEDSALTESRPGDHSSGYEIDLAFNPFQIELISPPAIS
jgi:hypothetical protein